jgi:hypothetical protein
MLDQRTWEAHPIDYTKSLGNIYGNGSQTCCPKGQTYRDAQLGELAHSTRLSTHRSMKSFATVNPQRRSVEKVKLLLNNSHLEPQAIEGCNVITGMTTWSSRNTALRETQSRPFLARQMSKWFYNTFTDTAIRATHYDLLLEGLKLSYARAK